YYCLVHSHLHHERRSTPAGGPTMYRFLLLAAILSITAPLRAGEPAKPRLDKYGDPLPEGAVHRLGAVRFRHGEDPARVVYSSNGRYLASVGEDGLRVWTAQGKE